MAVGHRVKCLSDIKKTAPIWWFDERSWCQSLVMDRRASWVEEPTLKPNCRLESREFAERYLENLLCTICSRTLETRDSSDMGQ